MGSSSSEVGPETPSKPNPRVKKSTKGKAGGDEPLKNKKSRAYHSAMSKALREGADRSAAKEAGRKASSLIHE
eukprot:9763145-Alexandrium_andersonii.AAC.1